MVFTVTAAFAASSFSFQAQAAGSPVTHCYYSLLGGAPWAPKQKLIVHNGHVQCAATAHDAIGGYALSSQIHTYR